MSHISHQVVSPNLTRIMYNGIGVISLCVISLTNRWSNRAFTLEGTRKVHIKKSKIKFTNQHSVFVLHQNNPLHLKSLFPHHEPPMPLWLLPPPLVLHQAPCCWDGGSQMKQRLSARSTANSKGKRSAQEVALLGEFDNSLIEAFRQLIGLPCGWLILCSILLSLLPAGNWWEKTDADRGQQLGMTWVMIDVSWPAAWRHPGRLGVQPGRPDESYLDRWYDCHVSVKASRFGICPLRASGESVCEFQPPFCPESVI